MPFRRSRQSSGTALFGAFASTIRLLRWLLALLVGIYLCSGITRVGPNEDALVYRLGVLQREVHPPGLLFALPPPLDRVVRVPTRTQHEIFPIAWAGDEEQMAQSLSTVQQAATATPTPANPNVARSGVIVGTVSPELAARAAATANPGAPPAEAGLHPYTNGYSLTGDANIVQARFTMRWKIVDPFAFVQAMQDAAVAPLLEHVALDAATREMCGTRIDDALGPGLEGFRTRVLAAAQQRLDTMRLGVSLLAFDVTGIAPPVAAAAAFAEVTSAQVQARTTLEQARTYRARLLPSTQSEAFRLRAEADAAVPQLTTRATAEAASFLALAAEHRLSPALIETRLRAEQLEAVLQQIKTTTVLPEGVKPDLLIPTP